MKKNIVLCGFMGCGKTTVGRHLAKRTGREFVDMDKFIENKAGMKISQIFEQYGEDHFRELEHDACRELSRQGGLVIATGGGALTFERNVLQLKKNGRIVLIDVPVEEIKRRLKNDTTRPLLQCPDRNRVIDELYEKRLPLYRNAASVYVGNAATPYDTATNIMLITNCGGKTK